MTPPAPRIRRRWEAIAKDFGRNASATCHTRSAFPSASGLASPRAAAEGVPTGALRGTPRIA